MLLLARAWHCGVGVGATVGGAVPTVTLIVSTAMSPVVPLPRVASHLTDVVLIGRESWAGVHGSADDVCCWPVRDHTVVQTLALEHV